MKTTRREFLGRSAAFGLFNIVPAGIVGCATAPSNQLTRALIGFGCIAHTDNHLKNQGSRLVGICDPFEQRVRHGLDCCEKAGWGRVKAYENFLALLDDPGVDIVHICTPPHWHAVQCVMAARAGKDIWCEKPMTRTVGEGARVREYVKAKGRVFRLNTWKRLYGDFFEFGTDVKPLKQVVESGLLGKGPIRCTFGAGQGFTWKFGWSGRINERPQPVPKGFDYEMWLGPAPWKPYTDHRVGTTFRGYWDYDSGGLGDMAQHYLDPLQYILGKDETSPVKVDYVGPEQHPEAVGRFDRITLTYADGTKVVLDGDETLKGEPLLRGANGTCVYPKAKDGKTLRLVDGSGRELDAAKILADLPEPAPQADDFAACVRSRTPFAVNESTGFRSATMFNLGIAAERLGRGFRFDPETLHAVDDPEADRYLYQGLRRPWAAEFMKA